MKTNMKTKPQDIISYWEARKYEGDLGVDWCDADKRCWRCANEARLQRCHIIPNSLGGVDDPSNLVLLCCRCHKEAPNANDTNMMWDWIKSTKVEYYDTFWGMRGLSEYEKIYNRKPFVGIKVSDEKIKEAMREAFKESSVHYGEGGLNPSTLAFIMKKIEEKLSKKTGDMFYG